VHHAVVQRSLMVAEVACSISYGQIVATELYSIRKKTRKGNKHGKPTLYSLRKMQNKEKGKEKKMKSFTRAGKQKKKKVKGK